VSRKKKINVKQAEGKREMKSKQQLVAIVKPAKEAQNAANK
jgi:translation elongation factor EF-4